MSQFNRGISPQFVERLNDEYTKEGWWKAMADDRELFIAVRKDYINVYLNGNSLLKLWQEGNDLVGETHYKYLLAPESARPYVKVLDGKATIDTAANLFMGDLSDLAGLKRSANVYSGDEKKGVHQIVMSNPNVVDVEIAFGAENEKTRSVTANRIDFAALRQGQSGPEVVFYEAKVFANTELRAKNDKNPAIIEQLRRYRSFLSDSNNKSSLIDSYRQVCGNLASLEGVSNRYAPVLQIMRNVAADKCSLSICDDVRLVVFDYDDDQRTGSHWRKHQKKLKDLDVHLLMCGDAGKLTNGISHKAGF